MYWQLTIGASPDPEGTLFRVWAPQAREVAVMIDALPQGAQTFRLTREAEGYFAAHVADVRPGMRYAYRVDGGDPRPDPASRFQPEGVHGWSEVVDPAAFVWSDGDWRGLPLEDLVIYELHVGTATPQGTFDALIDKLDVLKALGVTAIELMPVADFPGTHNWGYDGVNLYAPSRAYGGPEGLRRLVDAAHRRGLAVLLDVVYNHFGPDGNYLRDFSRDYFTDRHQTPWGDAVNVDGPGTQPVRDFFVNNVLYWAHEVHLDGLRLDATHAIIDDSPTHLMAEMSVRVRASLPADRHFFLIAEHEGNDPALIRASGWNLDAVWSDDFHHQVRVALTGEQDGYYGDYTGNATDLAATMAQGWFYQGQVSPHLGHPRGAPAPDLTPPSFVYCIQNHDQVGNRALGERLNHTVSLAAYRAASTLLLVAPQTPLLWMGQEWAASTPFLFFTDHHPELGRMVTEGRRKEFAAFTAFSGTTIPDPQDPATFAASQLRWHERAASPHAEVLTLYQDLLALRHSHPALRIRRRDAYSVTPFGLTTLIMHRWAPNSNDLLIIVCLGDKPQTLEALPRGNWELLLDSEDPRYGGGGVTITTGASLTLNGPRAMILHTPQR